MFAIDASGYTQPNYLIGTRDVKSARARHFPEQVRIQDLKRAGPPLQ